LTSPWQSPKSSANTEDTYARYAKRYKLSSEEANDPRNRIWLKDKINADIEVQRLRTELEQREALQQEAPEEEAAAVPTAQQQIQPQDFFKLADQWLERNSSPEVEQSFYNDFLAAFGQKPEQADPVAAKNFTRTMSKYALNLMKDAIPALVFAQGPNGEDPMFAQHLESHLSSRYEGLGDIVKVQSRASAWDGIRQSDAKFQKLPGFNTPEFNQLLDRAAQAFPGFENFKYTDPKTGQPVTKFQNFIKKSEFLANWATKNQSVQPETAAKIVDATKKQVRQAAVKSSASQAIGAGQSKGNIAPRSKGNDDIFGAQNEYPLSQRI
jgi:hypothetical protein